MTEEQALVVARELARELGDGWEPLVTDLYEVIPNEIWMVASAKRGPYRVILCEDKNPKNNYYRAVTQTVSANECGKTPHEALALVRKKVRNVLVSRIQEIRAKAYMLGIDISE